MDKAEIDQFLGQALLARIATADPDTNQPHVVPVWYEWDGESLWISSFRSTKKIRRLQDNPLIAATIDVMESGEVNHGVIMEGQAELVTEPRELVYERSTSIYTRYLGPEGVLKPDPQSWIYDDENLLIKLTPSRLISW